jgi:hypothetical protein
MVDEKEFDRHMRLAQLMLGEFHYRHQLYWKLIFYSITVNTALMTASFVLYFDRKMIAAPIAILMLCAAIGIFCTLIVLSEAARVRAPASVHRALLYQYLSPDQQKKYTVNSWDIEQFDFWLLGWKKVGNIKSFVTSDISELIPQMLAAYLLFAPIILAIYIVSM